ncbi:hypothetical protein LCGC14_0330210 [marine sediment metagenome]|uniref:dATP/dGTP diphosphohydrolase N-terminal domain-containing protein n=1 Tax=marine sediment metagenome TaxID=412755 RepID=A0A0F9WP11_9ZZZZ
MTYQLKQGKEKQTFETGAQRDTQESKPRLDLISPIFLERLGMILTKGAEHYGERNWEKGMPLSRLLSSAARHLNQTIDGLEDEDHPAQAAWNLMAYIHTEHRIKAGSLPAELDDLPREKNLSSDLTFSKKEPTVDQSAVCCGVKYPLRGGYFKCPNCRKDLDYA